MSTLVKAAVVVVGGVLLGVAGFASWALLANRPHRLQPFEMVEGAAVFWSLGNFVWPSLSLAGSTTGVARVVVNPDGSIEACLIPAYIESHGHPVISGAPECGHGS